MNTLGFIILRLIVLAMIVFFLVPILPIVFEFWGIEVSK